MSRLVSCEEFFLGTVSNFCYAPAKYLNGGFTPEPLLLLNRSSVLGRGEISENNLKRVSQTLKLLPKQVLGLEIAWQDLCQYLSMKLLRGSLAKDHFAIFEKVLLFRWKSLKSEV